MRLKVKRVLFDRKIKLLKDTIFLINSIHILEHKSLKTGLLKEKKKMTHGGWGYKSAKKCYVLFELPLFTKQVIPTYSSCTLEPPQTSLQCYVGFSLSVAFFSHFARITHSYTKRPTIIRQATCLELIPFARIVFFLPFFILSQ